MDIGSAQATNDLSDRARDGEGVGPSVWPLGSSGMATRIRAHEWSKTRVGSISGWPGHIRCAIQLVLDTPEPACLLWTSEGIHIYNDAYTAILGHRHPQALGRTFARVWPESAHLDEFRHASVFRMGAAVLVQDRPYVIREQGVARERFFTMSVTPLRHPSGPIDAVLQRLIETSDIVEARQRLRQVDAKFGEQRADLTVQLALADAITDESARQHAAIRSELYDREESLRLALMAGRLATWDWNIETGQVIWSDQMYPLYGYALQEIEPSFGAWTQRVHPDDLDGLLAQLDVSRAPSERFAHVYRSVHPDNSVRWCCARGRFFYNEAGRPIRMLAVVQDVTEEHQARQRQKLLVAELQHRTRNLLGVIRSLATLTCDDAGSLEQFRVQFADRLDALSRAQGLLSRADSNPITLGALIRMEFEALGATTVAQQLSLYGPEIHLQNSIVQALALVIHELTTNALKYGALLTPQGRISIRWNLVDCAPDEPQLRLEWLEERPASDPAAVDWEHTGYGRELLEHMLPYVLDAKTAYQVTARGARFTMDLPLYIDELTHVAKVTPAH